MEMAQRKQADWEIVEREHRVDIRPASARPRRRLSLWDLLVWAYRDQLVGGVDGVEGLDDDAPMRGCSGDGIAVIERIAHVGCRIDGGAWRRLNDRMHVDAVAVAEALRRLEQPIARLLAECARQGEQPEPPAAAPCPFPTVVDSRTEERFGRAVIDGRRFEYRIKVAERVVDRTPRWEFRGRGRRVIVGYDLVPTDVLFCPLTWWPSAEMVAHQEAVRQAFDTGMEQLAAVMRGVALKDHVLV